VRSTARQRHSQPRWRVWSSASSPFRCSSAPDPFAVVPFAALIALVALRRDSRAAGGGFLVAFSSWWIYFIHEAVERCDAFNRSGGSCAIFGTTEQVVLAGCVALVGLVLIAVAMRDRLVRSA